MEIKVKRFTIKAYPKGQPQKAVTKTHYYGITQSTATKAGLLRPTKKQMRIQRQASEHDLMVKYGITTRGLSRSAARRGAVIYRGQVMPRARALELARIQESREQTITEREQQLGQKQLEITKRTTSPPASIEKIQEHTEKVQSPIRVQRTSEKGKFVGVAPYSIRFDKSGKPMPDIKSVGLIYEKAKGTQIGVERTTTIVPYPRGEEVKIKTYKERPEYAATRRYADVERYITPEPIKPTKELGEKIREAKEKHAKQLIASKIQPGAVTAGGILAVSILDPRRDVLRQYQPKVARQLSKADKPITETFYTPEKRMQAQRRLAARIIRVSRRPDKKQQLEKKLPEMEKGQFSVGRAYHDVMPQTTPELTAYIITDPILGRSAKIAKATKNIRLSKIKINDTAKPAKKIFTLKIKDVSQPADMMIIKYPDKPSKQLARFIWKDNVLNLKVGKYEKAIKFKYVKSESAQMRVYRPKIYKMGDLDIYDRNIARITIKHADKAKAGILFVPEKQMIPKKVRGYKVVDIPSKPILTIRYGKAAKESAGIMVARRKTVMDEPGAMIAVAKKIEVPKKLKIKIVDTAKPAKFKIQKKTYPKKVVGYEVVDIPPKNVIKVKFETLTKDKPGVLITRRVIPKDEPGMFIVRYPENPKNITFKLGRKPKKPRQDLLYETALEQARPEPKWYPEIKKPAKKPPTVKQVTKSSRNRVGPRSSPYEGKMYDMPQGLVLVQEEVTMGKMLPGEYKSIRGGMPGTKRLYDRELKGRQILDVGMGIRSDTRVEARRDTIRDLARKPKIKPVVEANVILDQDIGRRRKGRYQIIPAMKLTPKMRQRQRQVQMQRTALEYELIEEVTRYKKRPPGKILDFPEEDPFNMLGASRLRKGEKVYRVPFFGLKI